MTLRSVFIGMIIGSCIGSGARAQAVPHRLLLAISKVDHQLVIMDPASLKVIGKLPTGDDPHEVIASPDGTRAYVSNTGFGLLHQINVYDLVHLKALPSIETLPLSGPHGMAFAGGKLWFTAQGSKAVGRIDPQLGVVDWSMGTGQNTTHMIHVTADVKHIYTTNVESGTVSIIDNELVPPTVPPTGVLPPNAKPRMDWLQTLITTGKGSEGAANWRSAAGPTGLLLRCNSHDL